MDHSPEGLHDLNDEADAPVIGPEATPDARATTPKDPDLLTSGGISLHLVSREAWLQDRPLYLTQTEFELLRHFVQRPRWIWTRTQLLEEIWGYQFADPRVVTVHIGNLRRKLAQAEAEARFADGGPSTASAGRSTARRAYIETARGIGYRFADHHPPNAPRSVDRLDEDRVSDRTPFVGRRREMTALRGALSGMLAGYVRIIGLAGEAGIGKTRLVEEFASHAQQCGVEVSWGNCHEGPVRAPYEPWEEILDSWDRDRTRVVFGEELDGDGLEVPASNREGRRARLLLLERLTDAVHDRATGAPVCLVIEDAHWADVSTLLALQHVIRRIRDLRLMLVVTYRPGEGSGKPASSPILDHVLADIARSSGGLILTLSPLSEVEVHEFVDSFAGGPTPDDPARMRSEAYRQSEGNPFFLTQFMRLLSLAPDRARSATVDLHMGRHEGVRSVVLERVSALSVDCRRWLDAAGVCGREFLGAVATEANGLVPELLPKLLNEAAAARLITLDEDRSEVCRFAHSLIRDVLYGELSPEARASLHARVGAILERRYASDIGRHATEIAHHYCCALSLGCAERAFDFCVQAGDIATRKCAWDEACRHYQRALDVEPLLPAAAGLQRWAVAGKACEDMGDAYALAGAFDRSIEAYENAASRLPREDRISLARLKQKQMLPFQRRGQNDQALFAVAQAQSLLGPPAGRARDAWWQEWIEVELDRSFLHYQSGEVEEAEALIQSVRAATEAHGSEAQRTKLLVTVWLVDLRRRRYVATAETLRLAEDGARIAVARGSLLDLEDAEMMLGTTLFFFPEGTEERERAGAHLYRYRELAQQTNDHVFQIDAAGMLSTWHRLRGDVDHARRYAQEALSLAAVSQVVKHRAEAHGNAAWAAWRAGDRTGARTEAGAALDDFEARSPRSPFEWTARWPVLALSAANGDLRHATRQARAMLAPLQQKMPDDLEELARSFSDQQVLGLPEAECSLESLMALARAYGYL